MTPPVFPTRAPMSLPYFPDMLGIHILAEAAADHGVTVAAIKGSSRVPHIVAARVDGCRRLRAIGLSFPRIAQLVGYADHTSAMHACKGSAA